MVVKMVRSNRTVTQQSPYRSNRTVTQQTVSIQEQQNGNSTVSIQEQQNGNSTVSIQEQQNGNSTDSLRTGATVNSHIYCSPLFYSYLGSILWRTVLRRMKQMAAFVLWGPFHFYANDHCNLTSWYLIVITLPQTCCRLCCATLQTHCGCNL